MMSTLGRRPTESVLNQPPPLVDYNLFETDPALAEALQREGGEWARAQVAEFGRAVGTEEAIAWGFAANRNEPVLHTHDRYGNRRDEVEFHPAWHSLMRLSMGVGCHNLPLSGREGTHVVRAAMFYLASQNEAGHGCPVSMTNSVAPVLRANPEIWPQWDALLRSTEYDPRFLPAAQKKGVLFGMAMTEKQGGSDVRANTTAAVRIAPGEYLLTGHKWFCSAPMCDAFLVLAQAPGGLTCFLLPRWTPAGERNRFHIQRLKDKLGNRSNASSEVEFDGAWARLVGEEGRGVATIIEMVQHTRLDCVIGSTAQMRQALVQAVHHARHRSAFGLLLIDQPLMRNVLADLALESEAATLLMMRLARAFDQRCTDPAEHAFARLATSVAKFWVCKRAPAHVAEALECLGGNGYVEESMLPRLYRESPLNSIWEGSGNVICLDVLRAMRRDPDSVEAFAAELRLGGGANRSLEAFLAAAEADLKRVAAAARTQAGGAELEAEARRLTQRLCLALQASLVARHSPAPVVEAFAASRLSGGAHHVFGTLDAGLPAAAILERAFPAG